MPIYEYRCSACSHELELLQKFADPPLVTCTKCGHPTLIKLVSLAGFQLKGSGWYQTDFKGSGTKPAPNGDSDASKGESASNSSTASDASKGDTATGDAAKSGGEKSEGAKSEGAATKGKTTEASAKTVKPSTPGDASRSSP